MTHGEFAQAVMKEWDVAPMKLRQTCCCQWYLYSIPVKGKNKIIGKYTLVDMIPAFVLVKKDGTEERFDVTG